MILTFHASINIEPSALVLSLSDCRALYLLYVASIVIKVRGLHTLSKFPRADSHTYGFVRGSRAIVEGVINRDRNGKKVKKKEVN